MQNSKADNIIIGNLNQETFDVLLNKYSGIFVLLDENTLQHCWPILKPFIKPAHPIQIASGEIHKNMETCQHIWQELMKEHADRNSVLVNIGGGVLCDMGAFAASTYKRGIDYINIPTTLLAQVDASIGGKTGINFQLLKNQIGTFCNPTAILINHHFLQTLNEKEWLCGYAEMLKHALIDSREYWKALTFLQGKRGLFSQAIDLEKLIFQSIQVKEEIVKQDPHENGIRKILNFGHTIGHAIETLSLEKDKDSLTHGEAIAIGMICESYLSKEICGLSQIDLDSITQFILSVYPPYKVLGFEDKLLHLMTHDKKNVNKAINFTLLKEIGKPLFNQTCSLDIIKKSFEYYYAVVEKINNK